MKLENRKPGQRLSPFGHPNPIDVHVGQRLRLRRTLLGLNLEQLGDALGVAFQQVQRYERSTNRVSASRLFELAQLLDCPVSYFFDAMPAVVVDGEPSVIHDLDPITKRETITLVRTYLQIRSRHVRKRVLRMAQALSADAMHSEQHSRGTDDTDDASTRGLADGATTA